MRANDRLNISFCGIGGSGMLPLAAIVRASGARVAGSDRSLDAGRLGQQVRLSASRSASTLFAAGRQSGLAEGHDPGHLRGGRGDHSRRRPRARARPARTSPARNCSPSCSTPRSSSVAVGGTSGKSTVTGMIGWILHALHRQPTVMNGAVMKNFVSPGAPFASALVGDPELFVSEVDESDGSIALYQPERRGARPTSASTIMTMDELRSLFGGFLAALGQGGASTSTIPKTRAARRRHAAGQADRLRLRQPRRDARRPQSRAAARRRPLHGRAWRATGTMSSCRARPPQCHERAGRARRGPRAGHFRSAMP